MDSPNTEDRIMHLNKINELTEPFRIFSPLSVRPKLSGNKTTKILGVLYMKRSTRACPKVSGLSR